jgi:hypothetical protein
MLDCHFLSRNIAVLMAALQEEDHKLDLLRRNGKVAILVWETVGERHPGLSRLSWKSLTSQGLGKEPLSSHLRRGECHARLFTRVGLLLLLLLSFLSRRLSVLSRRKVGQHAGQHSEKVFMSSIIYSTPTSTTTSHLPHLYQSHYIPRSET